jgi:hypothetical protein
MTILESWALGPDSEEGRSMPRIKLMVGALVLSVVAWGALAQAATVLATPTLPIFFGTPRCIATNVGKRNINVQFELIRSDGTIASSGNASSIDPGHAAFIVVNTSGTTINFGCCRFTFTGNKNWIRANICLTSEAGGFPCDMSADAR